MEELLLEVACWMRSGLEEAGCAWAAALGAGRCRAVEEGLDLLGC